MDKVIQIDTREKPKAIERLEKQIKDKGYMTIHSKLYVGDYQLLSHPYLTIDRKQNLQELIGNVTHDHQRFKAEINRANEIGIHVVILIEHSQYIKSIDDLRFWKNPRLRTSPRATTGMQLAKILNTMQNIYDVEFQFCCKQQTGLKIVELLEEGYESWKKKRERPI